MPLTQEQAHTLIDAAQAYAREHDWRVTVAVVDEGGLLVASSRMDGAFPVSPQIAEAKAVGAALWHRDGGTLAEFREQRPAFFDVVSSLIRLPLVPGEGSLVIRDGDRVLGAVGVSGAHSSQDRECAEAGLRAVFG